MFRHYRVIFRELVFITSPSYLSISIAATVVLARYIPGEQDSNINTHIVYTATTQIDFVRIVTIILPHFISNWTTLMF